MYLAGDVGGTKTLLCLGQQQGAGCALTVEARFENSRFRNLGEIIRAFLNDVGAPGVESVCLGVAGPVQRRGQDQFVRITNLPWEIDSHDLRATFGFPAVELINDFQAVGYGIEALAASDLVVLQAGQAVAQAPRALIGAGTGLGQGILVWCRDRYEAIATEGGHAEFGPTDALQLELARWLLHTEGHASYELILCGSGLARIYRFLREHGGGAESPAVAQTMRQEDPAAVITRAALEDADPLAGRALDLFVRIYGAQAGNLALTAGATGGVYVAGGIAPRIAGKLADGQFLRAFRDKANMSHYVEAIPVQVVLDPGVGLKGALRRASLMGSSL
jgi:glucokinase